LWAEGYWVSNVPPENNVDRWRAQAAEALNAAMNMADPASRRLLLQIATAYERLAAHSARRAAATLRATPGVSFGPDVLAAICQAFDDAWSKLAPMTGDDPHEIEAARLELANSLLAVADEDSRVPSALRDAALQALALRRV
jgi:hypothetical protein